MVPALNGPNADPTLGARDPFLLLGSEGERAFDARAIERELRSMWKSSEGADESGSGGARGPFYRSALTNWIVPLEPGRHDAVAAAIVEVTRLHPARLFRIQREPEPGAFPGRLSSRATALCHLRSEGGGFVCSEQVLLEWTEATGPLVPSAVSALAIGDLPVVLLALPSSEPPPWGDALEAMADSVIVDSGVIEAPWDLPALWGARATRPEAALHDLAWARLAPWRALIAEALETPEAARPATAVRELTIDHGSGRAPSGAWLLAAWLAVRLGWRFLGRTEEEGLERLRFEDAAGPVSVLLVRTEGAEHRRIRRVQLRAPGPDPMDIAIEHRGTEPTARVERRAPAPATYESTYPYRDLPGEIVGELRRHGSNRSFVAAAALARAIIER